MKHTKYDYVKKIIESSMPVLLVGQAGSGKSTLLMQIAQDLSLPFHSISCTKQMSVSALLGFISINGAYIPTQLRHAYENGGLFLLDELDASDANVLLTLNTIENGFISFPDKIVHAHPDFRLCATANPFNDHSTYTGRSKLDFSTIDRYFVIELERDDALEVSLTSQELFEKVSIARTLMRQNGISQSITMRDSIRMHKLHSLEITDCVFKDIAFKDHTSLYNEFTQKIDTITHEKAKASATQSDATTIDELWDIVQREASTTRADVPKDVLTYDDLMNAAKRASNRPTHTEEEYDQDILMERKEAFNILQDNISRGREIPFGWKIIRVPTNSSDEYFLKGPRFTHKFSASEFIPF